MVHLPRPSRASIGHELEKFRTILCGPIFNALAMSYEPKWYVYKTYSRNHLLMRHSGNDPKVPKLADGSRDLDLAWSHVQTWGELEKLSSTGKAKAIGVANYSVPYMKQLLKSAKTVPAVNQIENHPYLPQQDIVDLCKENNIHITAYSPLGSSNSPLLQEPEVKSVAQRKGVSVATILLSYHGISPESFDRPWQY